MTLSLDATALRNALDVRRNDLATPLTAISAGFRLRRRGVEAKLVTGDRAPMPDPVLLRALADAHRWTGAPRSGIPLGRIAREAGHHDAYIRTRGQLAFLSPKIQTAIRGGTQPVELTLRRIMHRPVPLDWQDQERLYGL